MEEYLRGEDLAQATILGHIDMVKKLIAQGADVDEKDEEYGSTALMFAASHGSVDIVQALLDAGADVNIQDHDGDTALMRAATNDPDIECESDDMQSRLRLQARNCAKAARMLIDAGADVNIQNEAGETALMAAVHYGNEDIAKILIDAGSNIFIKDRLGYTALMLAITFKHTGIVSLLIKAGAIVNSRDEYGYTPLLEAARAGRGDIVKVLIEAGANAKARNVYGKTAADLAEFNGYMELSGLLRALEQEAEGAKKEENADAKSVMAVGV